MIEKESVFYASFAAAAVAAAAAHAAPRDTKTREVVKAESWTDRENHAGP